MTKMIQITAVLAMVATAFNIALVALYYVIGMWRQENVLNRQIELAKDFCEPVPIFIPVIQDGHAAGASFLATQYWFEDRQVAVAKLLEPPVRPRMKINKTATIFPLPKNWRLHLKDPKDEAILRNKGLIED